MLDETFYVIFKHCEANSFIGAWSLVHVSSVYLFLSMNNFLADGWLVGDSKQQASLLGYPNASHE